MRLLKPLPSNRTLGQIKKHYTVEKEIAEKLKTAVTKEEREAIYATMYQTLFEQVPDHPRTTQRNSEELTQKSIRSKDRINKDLYKKNMWRWYGLQSFRIRTRRLPFRFRTIKNGRPNHLCGHIGPEKLQYPGTVKFQANCLQW